nr:MAG TPA: head closure knob [Caudoviricetes sp.]
MKEWYLEHTPPESTSGYESDAMLEYGESDFTDILYTDFAKTVTLYNYDLSESKEVRCIVQGTTADTQLKSMERIFLFEIGTVKAGMYIFFENRYWLIDGYPGNNGSYEKATSVLCQYNLRWQNAKGEILERWCSLTSASKYDVGENGNNTILLTSNNYSIKIPYDDEVIELEDKRVFIDKRKTNPTKVFKLTRDDDVLYDYGDEYHGSILNFIVDKDEFNPTTDNQELRICNYRSTTPSIPDTPDTPTEETVVSIVGSGTLRIGRTKTWTVEFKDKDENDVAIDGWKWNIKADFDTSELVMQESELSIKITAQDDDSLVDESFLLQILIGDSSVMAEKQIDIVGGY